MSRTAELSSSAAGQAAARTFQLCFAAALLEGFDMQSAGVAAPKMAADMMLNASQLGWAFGANGLGLLVGAGVGGWISDHVGRRWVLIASMLVFGVFSLGTAIAQDANLLIFMRFLTGVGLGGAMPNLIALTAEQAPARKKAMAVILMSAAMPLGGAGASLLLLFGGADFDWRMIFYVGGWLPLALAILLIFALPESPAHLRRKVEGASLQAAEKVVLEGLFGRKAALATFMLWTSFLFTLAALYTMLNWLPALLVAKGFAPQEASLAALSYAIGGAAGAVVMGVAMGRLDRRVAPSLAYVGGAVSVFALAVVTSGTPLIYAVTFGIGFFLIGAQFILYGTSPLFYPARVRGAGVGFSIGAGRIGAMIGPIIAAQILALGHSPSVAVFALLPALAIAFVAVAVLTWRPAPDYD